MWLNISLVLRIEKFSAIAIVFWHRFIILKFALRACPIKKDLIFLFVFVYIVDPFFDTRQMHGQAAT
jgi:hypothetical protein